MKEMTVSTHAIMRCHERLGGVFGNIKTRTLRKKLVRQASRGVRLTAREVQKLGLLFCRGREYRRLGNTVYVLSGMVIVTIITIGGAINSAVVFF